MCTQKLWRLVKPWKLALSERRESKGRLRDWGATIFTENGDSLVIAMEVQTYLTLVFPYGEGDEFHAGFADALVSAFWDVGIDQALMPDDLSAVTAPLCLSRLTDPRLREALKVAQFTCGTERAYHDDLRTVQRNLNEFPHDLPPDFVPASAVRRLFSRPPLRPA